MLLKFIFLSQLFIEYIIGVSNEKQFIEEFNFNNLINDVISLNKKIEKYIEAKNIVNNDFMIFFCDTLFNLFKNKSSLKEKDKIEKEIGNLY